MVLVYRCISPFPASRLSIELVEVQVGHFERDGPEIMEFSSQGVGKLFGSAPLEGREPNSVMFNEQRHDIELGGGSGQLQQGDELSLIVYADDGSVASVLNAQACRTWIPLAELGE